MAYREHSQHPRLAGLVRLIFTAQEQHRPGSSEHRFVPERLVRLMFYAGETYVGDPAGTLVALPSAYLIGMQRGPLRAVSLGQMLALGVEL